MAEKKTIASFAGEYAFLSNLWREADGLSIEHRLQAARATLASDRQAILSAPTPTEARRIATRRLTMPVRADWDDVRVAIMRELLEQKFADPSLRASLIATGTAELIAADVWDDEFWNVNSRTGAGANWLGKLLMELRASLGE